HPHLLEPVGRGLLVGGFENADGLALGQATEAAIALDHGIVLCGLGHLVDLFAGHAARRQRVNAHELRHDYVSSERVTWFGPLPARPRSGNLGFSSWGASDSMDRLLQLIPRY